MTNEQITAFCEGVGDALHKCLPRTHGFVLLVCEPKAGGEVNYLSDMDREVVIKLFQHLIKERNKERS